MVISEEAFPLQIMESEDKDDGCNDLCMLMPQYLYTLYISTPY